MVHIVVHVHVRYALFHCQLHSQCGNTCTTYLDVVGTLHEINKDPSILKIQQFGKKINYIFIQFFILTIVNIKLQHSQGKIPKNSERKKKDQ